MPIKKSAIVSVLILLGACAPPGQWKGSGSSEDPNAQYRIAADVNQKDKQGPPANLSGGWLTEDYTEFITIQQEGNQATAVLHSGDKVTVHGEVQGRVFQGVDNNKFGFTLSADPNSGVLHIGAGKFPAFRFLVGPASEEPRAAKDPILSGGMIYRLPFDPKGQVNFMKAEHPKCTLRECVVFLRQTDLGYKTPMSTSFDCVPLDPTVKTSFMMRMESNPYFTFFTDFIDSDALRLARGRSKVLAKMPITLDGQPHWCMLVPFWTWQGADRQPVAYQAEIFQQDPDEAGVSPVEILVGMGGRTPDKGWQTQGAFIRKCSKLTRLLPIFEGDLPVRVEVSEVKDPRIDEFWMVMGTTAEMSRWYTTQLMLVKEKGLAKLLKDSTNSQLQEHVEHLEEFILNMNRMATANKQMVETMKVADKEGKQTAFIEETKAKISTSTERIEVLKPVLVALKEEIANRQK